MRLENPRHAAKIANCAAGIVVSELGTGSVTQEELGGGIDLTLFSAVPSGSGLGTSSILGSAIISCLSRMLGRC